MLLNYNFIIFILAVCVELWIHKNKYNAFREAHYFFQNNYRNNIIRHSVKFFNCKLIV